MTPDRDRSARTTVGMVAVFLVGSMFGASVELGKPWFSVGLFFLLVFCLYGFRRD